MVALYFGKLGNLYLRENTFNYKDQQWLVWLSFKDIDVKLMNGRIRLAENPI